MRVQRWDSEKDGPFSETAMRNKLEKMGYRVSRYVYPPGTEFPEHAHSMDKIDGVVSGRFRMKTEKLDVVLERGDHLSVPRGTVHSAEVVGDNPVVSLDATKS